MGAPCPRCGRRPETAAPIVAPVPRGALWIPSQRLIAMNWLVVSGVLDLRLQGFKASGLQGSTARGFRVFGFGVGNHEVSA